MKKVFIISFAAFLLSFNVKADDGSKTAAAMSNISDNSLKHFGYTFYRASNVNWSLTDSYQKATFELNGVKSYAIYSNSGDLLVATQAVAEEELPERAKHTLASAYKAYKVNNAVKVLSRPTDFKFKDDTNSYWVSLINEKEQVILLISPDAEIAVVSTKKIES